MVIEESDSPSVRLVLDRLDRCLPDIPPEVVVERRIMMRQLVTYTWAERELTLATNPGALRQDWNAAATGLVDALVGLWLAPVSAVTGAGQSPATR